MLTMDKTEKPITKKITLRDKKKAQPGAKIYFSEAEKKTIIQTVAKTLTVPQTKIFFYQCQALGLNPLLNEICAITYKLKDGTRQMSIQVMRDGFLTIAHRSGKFAGIESGVKVEPGIMTKDGVQKETELVGWAKVYHKDFKHPVYQEADFSEYNNDRNPLWKTKPKTMIKKVAESMALRKAFNVSGVYAPEEMEVEIARTKQPEKLPEIERGDGPATETQIATIKALDTEHQIKDLSTLTKQKAAETIKELAQKKK